MSATIERPTRVPDPGPLPDGYYAVPDPDDPAVVVTCHRNRKGKRQFRVSRVWARDTAPRKDTRARSKDVAERLDWFAEVVTAVLAAPEVARKEFSDFSGRCGSCGQPLTDPESKLIGLGPKCRGAR